MFKEIKIGNEIVSPAFSMAPMAGVTHSAFRRLLAEFGGFGTTSTEMLAGTAVLNENINKSRTAVYDRFSWVLPVSNGTSS